jgi:anti-sigma factor RsiW
LKSNIQSCAICGGDKLTGFLDGTLDGETMRKVDAHLRTCADCMQSFRSLEETRALLRRSRESVAVPGATFWADAYRRARLEAPLPARGNPVWRFGRPRFSILAMSTSLVAMLALTLLVSAPVGNHSQAPNAPQEFDQVDVLSYISAHADYVAGKRLADGSSNRIIRSDMAAQTTGDTSLTPTEVMSIEPAPNGTSD